MTDCHQLIDWLTGSLTDRLTFWLADWLTNWLTDWLTGGWLADWLTDFSAYQLTDQYYWLADWFNYWLTVWLIDCLTDWLAHWLIDLSGELTYFMLRKGINFNAVMIWMKITAIADPDESDWRFISDQICLADSSRLQQAGFWAYLQYCTCKCCVHCFVIQLLSEPDKLKLCSLFKVR